MSSQCQLAPTRLYSREAPGVWLKANLHTHTDRSDGRWSVADCCEYYAAHGYDLLAITDHWLVTDAGVHAHGLLMLPGIELNGWTEPGVQHHILGLGVATVPARETAVTASSTVAALRNAGGLPIIAHPEWSRQTAVHLSQTTGAHLLEVYNATSEIREGNGVSTAQWNDLLNRGERWFAIASDDTHMLPGYEDRGKAWIQVRAAERSVAAVLDALAAGHFWSTTGPILEALEVGEDNVTVHCSPCVEARAIIDGTTVPQGAHTSYLTRFSVSLPNGWRWFRIECQDSAGGVAWSNPFFNE